MNHRGICCIKVPTPKWVFPPLKQPLTDIELFSEVDRHYFTIHYCRSRNRWRFPTKRNVMTVDKKNVCSWHCYFPFCIQRLQKFASCSFWPDCRRTNRSYPRKTWFFRLLSAHFNVVCLCDWHYIDWQQRVEIQSVERDDGESEVNGSDSISWKACNFCAGRAGRVYRSLSIWQDGYNELIFNVHRML